MLVNIDPIAPGDNATPNLWNERFGAITEVVNGNIDSDNLKDGSVTYAKIASDAFQQFYPVGSIYMNATDGTNPGGLLGFGTWQAFGAGRVPVGIDSTQTEFTTPGQTGGDKNLQSHNHTGGTDAAGYHSHGVTWSGGVQPPLTINGGSSRLTSTGSGQQFGLGGISINGDGNHAHSFTTSTAGSGTAGNLQPYITVYMWRRIA